MKPFILFVFVLCLIALAVHATEDLARAPPKKAYILAMNKCNRKSPWTLHGLWPQWAKNCGAKFDVNDIVTIRSDLNRKWPSCPVFSNLRNVRFWTWEYEKHGSCMTSLTQTEYFEKSMKLLDLFKSLCSVVIQGECRIALDRNFNYISGPNTVSPVPITPAPVTGTPVTGTPVVALNTSFVHVSAPDTVPPVPVTTPAPVTPAPVTPVTTPAPVTPAPVTPVTTPAPVTPVTTPAPVTPTHVYTLAMNKCKSKIPWNSRPWTLHGLWPKPMDCTTNFDLSQLMTIENVLKQKWPTCNIKSTNHKFWKHEYNKHGSCMTGLSQVEYFEKSMKLLDSFKSLCSGVIQGECRIALDSNFNYFSGPPAPVTP